MAKQKEIMQGKKKSWNKWHLTKGLELHYPAYSGGSYPIDIERFTSSAAVLDMIMQVAKKAWATDAGLVRALDDLLQPQGTLCSGGTDKRLTSAQIRRKLKGAGSDN